MTPRPSDSRLLDLATEAYEAVLEPERWDGFLEGLAEELGAPSGILNLHDGARPVQSFAAHLEPHWLQAYAAYYWEHDVWFQTAMTRGTANAFCGSEMVPEEELEATEFYADFLRPQGIRHVLAVNVGDQNDSLVTAAFHRRPHQEDFGGEEVAVFDWMLGHLRRSARLSSALAEARERAVAFEEALDVLDGGVVLLDGSGHLRAMNRRAREMVAVHDGIRVAGAGLHTGRAEEQATFRRLVAAALAAPDRVSAPPGGVLAVSRPSGLRPYSVLVAPLPWMPPRQRLRARGVAVVVTDPERRAETPAEHLARLFGLTRGESRLASLLAEGCSLLEAAERLAITQQTARTVVKRVFSKTGTRGQADLVRLLVTSAVGLTSAAALEDTARRGS